MVVRLVMLGGFGVLVVGAMAVHYADRSLNYVEVQARVDNVSSECHLERTTNRVVSRRREWTRDMDCDLAKELRDEDPDMKGMHIKRTTKVMLRYTSPVDGQIHSGSYYVSSKDDEQKAPQPGSVVGILANTSKPDKIQRL